MACPQTEKQDQMYDFSHILDFCSQVKSLNIEGSYEKLGTSNIVPNELQFDLIPFKSLVDLKILGVPMSCIQSVGEYFYRKRAIFGITIVFQPHYFQVSINFWSCIFRNKFLLSSKLRFDITRFFQSTPLSKFS